LSQPNDQADGAANDGGAGTAVDERISAIYAFHERLMHLLSAAHTNDFLEIGITMSQAKLLYVVVASGQVHMAELPGRLGVSLSTVSGAVDRLVDAGLLTRREDPADRRQVLVGATQTGADLLDRFRELNQQQLHWLLGRVAPEDLAIVERAYRILVAATADLPDPIADPARLGAPASRPTGKDPV
jgi:DNA-binding MarR family transcriptional regulator